MMWLKKILKKSLAIFICDISIAYDDDLFDYKLFSIVYNGWIIGC